MKNERLLESLSFIDEKYIKEAEPKMKSSTFSTRQILGRVACLALVIALSLYLFIPFSTKGPNLTAYQGSEYFPIIERIADYRYQPSPYKNNFQYITAEVGDLLGSLSKGGMLGGDMAPGDDGADMNGSANGSYEETTDNQVSGVIEADLMKRTDKYIFRLGTTMLKVYDINKDDTKCVATFNIPGFEDERSGRYYEREMYLSEDGNTVTVISPYYNENYDMRIRVISIDVSDLNDIKIAKTISIDGNYNSSRMVDGKLLLITEYYAKGGNIDYNNPETYVPSITEDGESKVIKFEDIIYPEEIGSIRYSVVALIDEGSLDLMKAYALLDFYQDIYVSENNVYVTKEYTKKENIGDDGAFKSTTMSDIAVLGYTGDTLENKGVITTEGYVDDQYSMDEFENHLRVVTSTTEQTVAAKKNGKQTEIIDTDGNVVSVTNRTIRSASLAVFNLESLEKIAEVRNFAPNGESVSSVRFDGNAAYVCTAIVQTFTDPVFFFDLSDYTNITYTDTGVIDGFSSSLIQLGDGFLLGIGQENWEYNKIEVYEERDGQVVSVDVYKYTGEHSSDYKGYLIDRENDLFGLCITGVYVESNGKYEYNDMYVLLHFNGYELVEVANIKLYTNRYPDRVRAFIKDGYLYVTDDERITVHNVG